MKHLKELHAKHGPEGLVILAIHSQQGREKCADFVKEKGIDYVVCEDVKGKLAQAFFVDGYPDYQLVGRDGKIKVADLANAEVDKAIAHYLKEPVPADVKKPEKPATD